MPFDDGLLHEILYFCAVLGQEIWNPIDAAGWPGDKSWITSDNLAGRWSAMEWLVNIMLEHQPEWLRELAISLSDSSNDPYYITQAMLEFFTSKGLQTPTDNDIASVVFKYEVPQNEYEADGSWNLGWETAPTQVALLLRHIARLPEFQLM